MKADIELGSLYRALRAYKTATGKDMADIITHAAKTIAIGGKGVKGAAQLTPKVVRADIRSEIAKEGIAFRLLANPNVRKPKKLAGWVSKGHTRAEIRAAARTFVNARISSGASIATGWIQVGRELGVVSKKRVSKTGLPGQSTATKATPRSLQSVLVNRARGADKAGKAALQMAVNNASADMLGYAERKMAKTAKAA